MVSLSDIEIGIGTSSWGPSLIWNFGDGYDASDLREAFTQIISHPNILLDTAEIYGLGQSEQFIGLFSEETGKRPFTATKFFPFPWRGHWRTLPNALRASIHRLKTAQVDLYQIHNRLPPVPIEVWIHGLAAVAEQGLTRAVGVSNYDVSHTKRAHTALRRRGLHLASNQVR
ncbi:MAG: aldo/keto reductase, partial [Chloroflexota bacterium]